MVMVGWHLLITLRQTSSKRNGRHFCLIGKHLVRTSNHLKTLMSMFGYIDNDRNKVHRMAKDVLSPALGRPAEQLENLLPFGSTDHCLEKIRALSDAGVKRIHFWPVSDYLEQIEIFRNEIIPYC